MEITNKKKSKLHSAIDAIIKANDGAVTRQQIVESAQKPGTILHEEFKRRGLFDAKKSMKFAQLTYAGILLRQYHVWVSVENKEPLKVRAMVSLTDDRGKKGYRLMVSVMSDKEKRFTFLNDAKNELASFRNKYATLEELAPVFAAIDDLQ